MCARDWNRAAALDDRTEAYSGENTTTSASQQVDRMVRYSLHMHTYPSSTNANAHTPSQSLSISQLPIERTHRFQPLAPCLPLHLFPVGPSSAPAVYWCPQDRYSSSLCPFWRPEVREQRAARCYLKCLPSLQEKTKSRCGQNRGGIEWSRGGYEQMICGVVAGPLTWTCGS